MANRKQLSVINWEKKERTFKSPRRMECVRTFAKRCFRDKELRMLDGQHEQRKTYFGNSRAQK